VTPGSASDSRQGGREGKKGGSHPTSKQRNPRKRDQPGKDVKRGFTQNRDGTKTKEEGGGTKRSGSAGGKEYLLGGRMVRGNGGPKKIVGGGSEKNWGKGGREKEGSSTPCAFPGTGEWSGRRKSRAKRKDKEGGRKKGGVDDKMNDACFERRRERGEEGEEKSNWSWKARRKRKLAKRT